jgi:hypothetical protein
MENQMLAKATSMATSVEWCEMTDETDKKIADLEREVEALKAKVSPPKSTFKEMSDAEHRDWVHQMRERQANSWMPPDAIREMIAAEPKGFMKEVALRDARAPTGPSSQGAIPSSQQVSNVRVGGSKGWIDPRPLSNPPGVQWVDAQCIADEVRQRAELKRKLGKG